MRIAILSDIHGNKTAFEAILTDLQQTSPDLILHGGDLADFGARPAEIVDCIRDLGWQGVVGNTDELLFRSESLEEFASLSSAPPSLWSAIREMAAGTRAMLGDDRIAWLRDLPRVHIQGPMAFVHASPKSLWRAPAPEATDAELESIYAPLGQPIAVYAHIHRPYIRKVSSPQGGKLIIRYRQREPLVRRRPPRLLSVARWLKSDNPPCGVRRRQGGQSSFLLRPATRGLDRENPPRRLTPNALANKPMSHTGSHDDALIVVGICSATYHYTPAPIPTPSRFV